MTHHPQPHSANVPWTTSSSRNTNTPPATLTFNPVPTRAQ